MQFLSHLMILVLLIIIVLLMTAKVSSGFLHRPCCMHSNVIFIVLGTYSYYLLMLRMFLHFRRRCKIAEVLVEKNFDLAFQVIYEFNLPGNIDNLLQSCFAALLF